MWFSEPCFADGFVRCETLEGLQTSTEVVGGNEVGEVLSELVVAVVMVAFNRGFLDRPVHALDLTVGPRMPRLCQSMFYVQLGAGELERMAKEALVFRLHLLDITWRPAVAGGIGEVRPIVGEHGVDLIRHGGGQVTQEVTGDPTGGLLMQFDEGELGGAELRRCRCESSRAGSS
jgi:hypothetical protein